MVTYQFTSIATLYTCFKEKFGIPRQMNLVPAAPGRLVFDPAFSSRDVVRDLTGFSHIWLVFVFHQALDRPWSALVRPPRLGGNKKVGVFATRSPFRPNPIGMSAVKLEAVEQTAQGPVLHLSGVDILDNTPVLDIKPYLPWADAIPVADGGFAGKRPGSGLPVSFSPEAAARCRSMADQIPDLAAIITQMLENDPRPGYHAGPGLDRSKIYGIRLFDLDVKWQVSDGTVQVLTLDPVR
ncbi:MAG TPA: tRNA (N6-threonylcarbamoyladenosine(37)-N6)-methyltransferase TrmO [Desulfotignum sp.]|jgi:tRNA (adenine37-N6)-methyltransferase|nr:tRNA (N6-threonylcarbamoyladenosine(37)-N6)-methyltransferase TrmO [Desulfotignum sp.]